MPNILSEFEKFASGIEITKQEGTFSLLQYCGCLGGCFSPYSSRYYDFDFGFFVFFVNKEHGLILFDLGRYIKTTNVTYQKFIKKKNKTPEIADFKKLEKEVGVMYRKYTSAKIAKLKDQE